MKSTNVTYCNKKVCENSQTYRSNTGNLTEKLYPLGEEGGGGGGVECTKPLEPSLGYAPGLSWYITHFSPYWCEYQES